MAYRASDGKTDADVRLAYDELVNHCRALFRKAASEHLYVGMGRDGGMPYTANHQEGPMTMRLRKLINLPQGSEQEN